MQQEGKRMQPQHIARTIVKLVATIETVKRIQKKVSDLLGLNCTSPRLFLSIWSEVPMTLIYNGSGLLTPTYWELLSNQSAVERKDVEV